MYLSKIRIPNFFNDAKWLFCISFLCFFSCEDEKQEFNEKIINCVETADISICRDTISLNVKGVLNKGFLLKNHYFLSFIDTIYKNKSGEINPERWYQVSLDGNEVTKITFPIEVRNPAHFAALVKNDSLYFINHRSHDSYVLNIENNSVEKSYASVNSVELFQDRQYVISTYPLRNFGNIVSFYDKQNKSFYDMSCSCPLLVNKIHSKYIISNSCSNQTDWSSILEVWDPSRLTKRNYNSTVKKVEMKPLTAEGSKMILDSFDCKLYTSFVAKDNLFHVYSTSKDSCAYIGKLIKGKLTKDYELNLFPYYKNRINNSGQFLTFSSKRIHDMTEKVNFGLIEILNGEIRIHYIKSENTLI